MLTLLEKLTFIEKLTELENDIDIDVEWKGMFLQFV